MSTYASRIEDFNKSVSDAREHADNIASQIENLKAINRDSTSSLYDKVNDSIGGVAGAVGQAAQLYHTYKHGKVLTFLERHDINQALGKGGNGGVKNAGNELLNTIDQARNAPRAGLSPNSAGIQLPKASDLASSLKGRIIGNESQGAGAGDLGQLVGRKTALPDSSDPLPQSSIDNFTASNPETAETSFGSGGNVTQKQGKSITDLQPAEADEPTGTAIKASTEGKTLFTPQGLDPERAGASKLSPADREAFAKQFTESSSEPLSNPVNAISGGEKVVTNLAEGAGDLAGDVANAGKIAGKVGQTIGSTLGKIAGEGGGNTIADAVAGGLEAAAPETGPIAPLVAAVGGLVALGSSIAKMFHKNKPPPPVVAPPPAPATQIGANLSVSK